MDVVILVLIKTNKEELKRLKRIMSYLNVVQERKYPKKEINMIHFIFKLVVSTEASL